MKDGTKQEGNSLCNALSDLVFDYELQVNVPIKKQMHRFIPFTVKLLECVAIPPIFIKLSMV
jgi:hypothetical protein